MKLYEFVDKIEAMGEVEKKTETLNESADTSSAFWEDYWEGPSKRFNESLTEDIGDRYKVVYEPYERYTSSGVKEAQFTAPTLYDALCKLCDNMLLYLDREQIEEEQMTAEDIVDYISSMNGDGCDFIFKFENLSNGAVIIDGGDPEDFMDNWDDLDESLNEAMNDAFIKIYKTSDSIPNDAWDFPIEELDYLLKEHPGESFALLNNRLYEISDESLTEAANPENAEVNAVLRKWANSDRNRISKRDQKVLDDAGIKLKTNKYDAPHKYAVHKDNEGDILDLHRMDKRHIKNTHPDHDLANDLATTGRHWSNRDRYNKNKDPNFPWRNDAYREETPEESKALRPYSDEYKSLKRQVSNSEGYPYWHAGAERDLDDFRAKMAARKNESLNESNFEFGDYRDEFYSLIDGMDPVDVVDMMVSYMNEYDMDDLIKSLRAEVSAPDDMEEE